MHTVEGIYKNGMVELLEPVSEMSSAKVLVTFLDDSNVDLRTLGIDEEAAAELRSKFATFEDWNSPDMDVYNDYDDARSTLN